MTGLQEKNGLILFSLIAVVVLICAIVAFQATGPLGIEERFSSAAGSTPEEHGTGGGDFAGFSLEGNLLLYIVIVAALALFSVIIYRKYRI